MKLFQRLALAAAVTTFTAETAAAEWWLSCRDSMAGGPRDTVLIEEADSFDEACTQIDNNPLYGQFDDCVDATEDNGNCAERGRQ